MKHIIVALFSLVLSQAASADIMGTWSGAGVYSDSQGNTADCDITNTFALNENVLSYSQVSEQCGWTLEFDLDVVGSELSIGGNKIGTFSSNSISFNVPTKSNYHIDMTLTSENEASFEDGYIYDENTSDTVKATLTRSAK